LPEDLILEKNAASKGEKKRKGTASRRRACMGKKQKHRIKKMLGRSLRGRLAGGEGEKKDRFDQRDQNRSQF